MNFTAVKPWNDRSAPRREPELNVTTAGLRRRGLRLEYVTVAWNVVEAAVAVAAGVVAGSIALVGFGLDSLIEVFAAVVVIWEFTGVGEERERRALRLIALSFFALAAYVVVEAGRDLLIGAEAEESPVGIALAATSLLVMPALGLAKRHTGKRLGSATLVADSAETFLCAALSAMLLAGLLLNAVGLWWADPVAALGIAALAVREGREAWEGETCCEST
jgi:Predicted Co/Zn/Cd cation transporters